MKTTFLDEAAAAPSSNEKAALASVYRRLASVGRDFQGRTYSIASFWGGNRNYAEDPAYPMVRRMWYPGAIGPLPIGGQVLTVPIADVLGVPKTGLLLTMADDDQTTTDTMAQTPSVKEGLNETSEQLYPKYAKSSAMFVTHVADHVSPATAREITVRTGNNTGPVYGPQVRAGSIWVRNKPELTDAEAFPLNEISPGADITAETMIKMRDYIIRLWMEKGIQIGWNVCKNSTGNYGITLNGSDYRYFHNPQVGQGAGAIAPASNGWGINIPCRWTGRGRDVTVRCYVRVYARMSVGGDTGNVGVYNRSTGGGGGMTGPVALTNGQTITGSTWRWWPNTTTFNPATDPYFLLNADPFYSWDHVVLCGRRNSGSGSFMIGAYSLYICPSVA